MRKGYSLLLAVLAVLIFASASQAQTPVNPTASTFVGFDYAASAVTEQAISKFDLYADATKVSTLTDVTQRQFPFPALTPGQHTLEATATNGVGESAKSAALIVLVIVTVPDAPSNLRIITARWAPETGWVPTLEIV